MSRLFYLLWRFNGASKPRPINLHSPIAHSPRDTVRAPPVLMAAKSANPPSLMAELATRAGAAPR
jgi:hypothetical protein